MPRRVQIQPRGAVAAFALAAAAPQQRANPRQQLVQIERFGQIIVSAGVEAEHPFLDAVARGHHQHRNIVARCAQAAQQLDAVTPGQTQIEQQQVVTPAMQHRFRIQPVERPVHAKALVLQRRDDAFADHLIVFDQ